MHKLADRTKSTPGRKDKAAACRWTAPMTGCSFLLLGISNSICAFSSPKTSLSSHVFTVKHFPPLEVVKHTKGAGWWSLQTFLSLIPTCQGSQVGAAGHWREQHEVFGEHQDGQTDSQAGLPLPAKPSAAWWDLHERHASDVHSVFLGTRNEGNVNFQVLVLIL